MGLSDTTASARRRLATAAVATSCPSARPATCSFGHVRTLAVLCSEVGDSGAGGATYGRLSSE